MSMNYATNWIQSHCPRLPRVALQSRLSFLLGFKASIEPKKDLLLYKNRLNGLQGTGMSFYCKSQLVNLISIEMRTYNQCWCALRDESDEIR